MLLAELEICHSRPIAPTRRIALGRRYLPCDRAPGLGGVLLGAICARFGPELPKGLMPDVIALTREIELDHRIAQPRLRHRLQHDRVGLTRSIQRLYGRGEKLQVELDGSKAAASQLVLGAVYASATILPESRPEVLRAMRRGLVWRGEMGPALLAHLAGRLSGRLSITAASDPVGWALQVLGFAGEFDLAGRDAIRRRFRDALRQAHPDHGGTDAAAADRIADLSEARRILLGAGNVAERSDQKP